MEDWVHVHKTVPTPLDHSCAAVSLDFLYQGIPAMVSTNNKDCIHKISDENLIRLQ